MKTIAKNRTATIDQLFAKAHNAQVYSLSNYFIAQPISPEWVRKQLDTFRSAKLQDMGNGQYKVRVHGNLWFSFSA